MPWKFQRVNEVHVNRTFFQSTRERHQMRTQDKLGINQKHKTNWAGKQWQSLTRVPLSVFE